MQRLEPVKLISSVFESEDFRRFFVFSIHNGIVSVVCQKWLPTRT